MGLVYRALWNDDRPDLHSAVASTFSYWANNVSLPTSEPFVLDPFEVEADGTQVGAAQVTIYNEQSSLLLNVSTVCHQEGQQILVEADLEADGSLKPYRDVVSHLVQDLIDDGVSGEGHPRGGVLDISVDAQTVSESGEIDGLVDQINDPNRTVGLVLVMGDLSGFRKDRVGKSIEKGEEGEAATLREVAAEQRRSRGRADILAGSLAGVAVVKWIPWNLVSLASRTLDSESADDDGQVKSSPEDWDLYPGRARLYPVGIGAEDRSRTYHETVAGLRPGVLVDEIRSAIEPGLIALRLPNGLVAARQALEVASAQDKEISDPPVRGLELQETRELVAQLREELEVHRQLLEEVQRENDQLISQQVAVLMRENPLDADQGRTLPQLQEQLLRVSDAIRVVREELSGVEVPDEAVKQIQRLDTGIHARSDAKQIWKGLVALHCYAKDRSDKDRRGESNYRDFEHWCKRSNHILRWSTNPKKLAMNESKSVRRDPRLRSARKFPISSEVNPSGKEEMFPHLKISTGTQHAPRLYFYDDTLGVTGKIHIGFIGPHDLMPNSTT